MLATQIAKLDISHLICATETSSKWCGGSQSRNDVSRKQV